MVGVGVLACSAGGEFCGAFSEFSTAGDDGGAASVTAGGFVSESFIGLF
jgi:hypothetical protein